MEMKINIDKALEGSVNVAIFGHTRPDGDCVGSTMGLFNYILDNYPDIVVDVYLEPFSDTFKFIANIDKVKGEYTGKAYDTVFVLDASSKDRVGANGLEAIAQAEKSFNIDHHISNPKDVCKDTDVCPNASSASEVLFYDLDQSKLTKNSAECIYLGIIHDTGVFKFECTGQKTLEAVGRLISFGVDFPRIINDTYYSRTMNQSRITGYVMEKAKLYLNGKVIAGYVTEEDMRKYDVSTIDLDGVIDAIREVSGTEVAVFIYPVKNRYKVSMRSKYVVDVSRICQIYGGGGHVRAAGCSMDGEPEKLIAELLTHIEKNLQENQQ